MSITTEELGHSSSQRKMSVGSGSAAVKPSTRSVPATPSEWRSPRLVPPTHQRPAGPWSPPATKIHSPPLASASAAQGNGTWSPGHSSRSNSDGEGFNSLAAMSSTSEVTARPSARRTQSKPTAADQSARLFEIHGVDSTTPSAHRRSGARPLSMSAVPSAGRNSKGMHSASSDQWWEHVLPPGQLAERLRRAQVGSPLLSGNGEAPLGPSSGAGSSASSTSSCHIPSEKAIWSGLAGIARVVSQSDATRPASQSTRETRSAASAQAQQPRRSALRGSRASSRAASQKSEYTSGEGSLSSDGGSLSPGDASPPLVDAERATWSPQGSLSPPHARAQLEHSQAMSPGGTALAPWPQSRERFGAASGSPHGSFSRSSSGCRSRVVSETGLGLGFPVDNADALSSWEQSAPASIKPFPSSGSVGRASPAYYLSSTPESSEEEQLERSARVTTSTTTTTRFTRTLSTTSVTSLGNGAGYQLDDEREHIEASSIRRRVSFSQDVKSGASSAQPSLSRRGSAQFQGGAHGIASSSSRPAQSASQSARTARNEHAFDSLPPSSTWQHTEFRTGSGRRPRTMSRDGFSRRMPSYSAPTSPRNSIHLLDGDRPRFDMPRRGSPERDVHQPDLALLNSLNVAQTQLASAGNLALTLTRQLSAPLRPVLHFTLFATISSVTSLALLSFLCASYALTFWDDVGSRGRKVGVAASQARKTVEIGVEWGRRWLGVPALALPQWPASEEPTPSRPATKPATQHHRRRSSASSIVLAPLYFTMSVPVAIAHKLAPSSLAERFGVEVEEMQPPKKRRGSPNTSPVGSAPASASSSRRESWAAGASSPMSATVEDSADDAIPSLGAGSTGMPPRPPLSHLLPSIFFTLLLALFAGLASFIANRRAGKPAADAPMTAHGPAAPAQSRKVRPANSRKSSHISSPSFDFADQRFC